MGEVLRFFAREFDEGKVGIRLVINEKVIVGMAKDAYTTEIKNVCPFILNETTTVESFTKDYREITLDEISKYVDSNEMFDKMYDAIDKLGHVIFS